MQQAMLFASLMMFEKCQEDVIDNSRYGRPSTTHTYEDLNCVRYLLISDIWISNRMIGQTLNLQILSVHSIMTNDLKMWKSGAKLVPKVLEEEQKVNRMMNFRNIFTLSIGVDETWSFEYDLVKLVLISTHRFPQTKKKKVFSTRS